MIVEEALQEKLSRINDNPGILPVTLTTFKGNGVQPGVDIDDTSALSDAME